MYLKVLGSVLIIAATSGIGYWYSHEFQKHLNELQYLRQMFIMIYGEIRYTQESFGEVFSHLERQLKEPYAEWFRNMAENIQDRSRTSFSELWSEAIDLCLGISHLKKEDLAELKDLGAQMGYLDADTQLGVLKLYTEKLEIRIQTIRTGLASKKRLCNCLGIMSGIFIAIILV